MSKQSQEAKIANEKIANQRLSTYFLEHIKVTSFGKFANLIIGPFKPGFNVVYGPNEAGKTTINELAKSVMFGWPAARGNVNAYKPENADRAGSLFFKNEATGDVEELKRLRNTEAPSDDNEILSDIDKATHDTMFALTSDELMRLDKHMDITSHLLTAGSGTLSSPAQALDEINARIKDTLSRSANNPDSLTNLKAQQIQAREDLQKALEQTEHYRAQAQTLKNLQPRKETLEQTTVQLNNEIEHLQSQLTKLENLDAALAQNEETLEKTLEAEHLAQISQDEEVGNEIRVLSNLNQREEYRLRDSLDELDEIRIKLDNAVDSARETADKSKAQYEVLTKDTPEGEQESHERRVRIVRLATSIIVPLVLIIAGIYLINLAMNLGGISLYLLGGGLIVVAVLIGVVGLTISFRPSRAEEILAKQQNNVSWVVQQDEKALEQAEQAVKNHAVRIQDFLDKNNMTQAHGSIRRARYMLDQAREFKATVLSSKQNRQALALQRASLESTLARLHNQRNELCLMVGLPPSAEVYDLEQVIARKRTERDKTMQLSGETNTQVGEISQELQAALTEYDFDEIKLKTEILDARIKEANKKLATLFLAKRTLETAISDWEKKSQPEVYKQASRIFELMTDGAWKQVRMNAAGDIEVVDAVKSAYLPIKLSLGTRQQLYLSLRIALLMTAKNVGRALPIMCDDILVNFDRTRQRNAIKALCELARVRQVIMFTCHEEVMDLIAQEVPEANRISL